MVKTGGRYRDYSHRTRRGFGGFRQKTAIISFCDTLVHKKGLDIPGHPVYASLKPNQKGMLTMNATKKLCPQCGQEMELAERAYPMGSVFQLKRLHADIYCCPGCKRIALFAAEGDMVSCPVCGAVHPAGEKCVTCALDAAFGGTEARERLVPKG